MKQAEELTHIPRATLKLRIAQLMENGHIQRHGQGRGTWYSRIV
jgi:predicted HTH transcriptional regulator